jgi:hypothetical protein
MNNQITIERRQRTETREEVNKILASFATKEAKFYWLNALVKQGSLNPSTAGRIMIENGINQ